MTEPAMEALLDVDRHFAAMVKKHLDRGEMVLAIRMAAVVESVHHGDYEEAIERLAVYESSKEGAP